jgi:hypothetical protein
VVHDHQHRAVLSELAEDLPQPGLSIDQSRVMQSGAIAVQGDGVVAVLAHVQTENNW